MRTPSRISAGVSRPVEGACFDTRIRGDIQGIGSASQRLKQASSTSMVLLRPGI
jgi:hypothetical protein